MKATPCQAHDKESAKQLTAVEWLANKIQEQLNIIFPGVTLHDKMINQAKEMEKEQKKDFFNAGIRYGSGSVMSNELGEETKEYNFEQYYNQTFKSK